MTDAERVLWSLLRRKQLDGFRRQAPLGPFIADFFCPEVRLIIEVDGIQHFEEDKLWRDRSRTQWLEAQGFRVLRVTNDDVFRRAGDVTEEIRRVLRVCVGTPHPSPDAR